MRCYPSSGPIDADDQPESLWVPSSLVPGEIMASIEKALQIAARAHEGQKDKDGQPYILHPLRVMNAVEDEPAKANRDTAWDAWWWSPLSIEALSILRSYSLLCEVTSCYVVVSNPQYYDGILTLFS